MPEKDKSPYDILLERIEAQEERIKTLEAENKEVIEFNKALLNRDGTQRSVEKVDDSAVDEAKKKLNKYLEEN